MNKPCKNIIKPLIKPIKKEEQQTDTTQLQLFTIQCNFSNQLLSQVCRGAIALLSFIKTNHRVTPVVTHCHTWLGLCNHSIGAAISRQLLALSANTVSYPPLIFTSNMKGISKYQTWELEQCFLWVPCKKSTIIRVQTCCFSTIKGWTQNIKELLHFRESECT